MEAAPARSSRWSSPRALALPTLLVFLTFLLIECVLVARALPWTLVGDEWRYIFYAENLLKGYFSPPERIFLFNGPGYPLVVVPFAAAQWLDGARFANCLFHALAMAYAWVILRRRLRPRWALLAVALMGLYGPLYEHLPTVQTEVFCFFLTAAWIEHSLRAPGSRAHTVVAGVLLALMCLTKVVFGMVLLGFIILLLAVRLWRRRDPLPRTYLVQAALAMLLCLPWLGYTYKLTGRVFHWSSAGPTSFYWLTSPYPDEWGDWYHPGWVDRVPSLRAHHKALMDEIGGVNENPHLSGWDRMFNAATPEAADKLMAQSMRNIREHPLKFARNWCANVVRMFLDVPTTVRGTPFWNGYSVMHLPLLLWTAVVVALCWRKKIPPPHEWWPLGLFLFLSLGAYSLSSAVARYMVTLLPLWWLGFWSWLGGHPAIGAPGQGQQPGQAAQR